VKNKTIRRHESEKTIRRQNRRRAAIALLKDAQFFPRFSHLMEQIGVIGERTTCLILVLAGLTKDFDKPVSILIKGQSSTGKSETTKAVLSAFPPESVLARASMSRKAPVHGSEDLRGKILFIAEYRGAKDALYLTRLLQSEGTISHEYTTLSGRERGTAVASRRGSPVIFSTTTERHVFEDDETRFLSIQVDESPEQTQQVIAAHLSARARKTDNVDLRVWREAIRILSKKIPRFLYPTWFDFLARQIPSAAPRARRDTVRFLSLLEAVCLCRSYFDGRMRARRPHIEINFADYCVAHRILVGAFSSTFAGAHPQALRLARAVRKLSHIAGQPVTVKEVARSLKWEQALVYKYVKEAVAQNLIEYEPGSHVWNQKRLLPGTVSHTSFLPDPTLILQNCPSVGDQVRYTDPLTGKTIVLRRRTRWTREAE
jgi:hypothetical protein